MPEVKLNKTPTRLAAESAVDELVVVGVVQGHFGVKGWIKVLSYTRPPLEILNFNDWSFVRSAQSDPGLRPKHRQPAVDTVERSDETLHLAEGRWHGKGLVARLDGISNRESAERLMGATIVVHQNQFEELEEGEFYWTDLVGLQVKDQQGRDFGVVDHLVETGANDVLVVRKLEDNGQVSETLVPWSDQHVLKVNLEQGEMLVDWDAD